jgi:methylated-DNA-[protein]-cysteine S-methyltransferase
MPYYTIVDSPIDPLLLTSDGESITGLHLDAAKQLPRFADSHINSASVFRSALEQLQAYFRGELQSFDLPLKPAGTEFQKKVWQALAEIPYGTTVSYKTIAERIRSPKAVRAVGLANGRNPIAIILPCHRVIGADGKLTGYAGGLQRKQWLLALERRNGDGLGF